MAYLEIRGDVVRVDYREALLFLPGLNATFRDTVEYALSSAQRDVDAEISAAVAEVKKGLKEEWSDEIERLTTELADAERAAQVAEARLECCLQDDPSRVDRQDLLDQIVDLEATLASERALHREAMRVHSPATKKRRTRK